MKIKEIAKKMMDQAPKDHIVLDENGKAVSFFAIIVTEAKIAVEAKGTPFGVFSAMASLAVKLPVELKAPMSLALYKQLPKKEQDNLVMAMIGENLKTDLPPVQEEK